MENKITPTLSTKSKTEPITRDEPTNQQWLSSNNGFNLFARHLIFSEEFKLLNSSDRDQKLSTRWNLLSEQEKSEYKNEAEKVRKQLQVFNTELFIILINNDVLSDQCSYC